MFCKSVFRALISSPCALIVASIESFPARPFHGPERLLDVRRLSLSHQQLCDSLCNRYRLIIDAVLNLPPARRSRCSIEAGRSLLQDPIVFCHARSDSHRRSYRPSRL